MRADDDGAFEYFGSLPWEAYETRVRAAHWAALQRISTTAPPPQEGWLSCAGSMLAASATCAGATICTAETAGTCAPLAWTACAGATLNFLCNCCKGTNSLICNKIKDAC